MVLTVSFALSLVIGLSCHHPRREAKHRHRVDISVEISGPHDFAVRIRCLRQSTIHVHRIPPRVRDDRETPLRGARPGKLVKVICPSAQARIFASRQDDHTSLAKFSNLRFWRRSWRPLSDRPSRTRQPFGPKPTFSRDAGVKIAHYEYRRSDLEGRLLMVLSIRKCRPFSFRPRHGECRCTTRKIFSSARPDVGDRGRVK
jgi:hypothetical protein